MTWFGTFLVIWYVFNIAVSFYVIGKGGMEVTPGSAVFSILVFIGFIVGLLFIGTGFGI